MKYIVLILLVAFIARVDFIMDKIDSFRDGRRASNVAVTKIEDLQSDRSTVAVENDLSLKQSPKERLLTIIESFKTNPEATLRESAIDVIKTEPTLLKGGKDTEFEGKLFELRDLFYNRNPELIRFLNELLEILKGENKGVVIKFYSMLMDINMEQFLTAYSSTKDTNCLMARIVAGDLTSNEKVTLFEDRENDLQRIIKKESTAPAIKTLANSCYLVLGLAKDKLLNSNQAKEEDK